MAAPRRTERMEPSLLNNETRTPDSKLQTPSLAPGLAKEKSRDTNGRPEK